MVKANFKKIDLLRKRRLSNNLADPYFIDTNKYIKRGIYSGLILISISLDTLDWIATIFILVFIIFKIKRTTV